MRPQTKFIHKIPTLRETVILNEKCGYRYDAMNMTQGMNRNDTRRVTRDMTNLRTLVTRAVL